MSDLPVCKVCGHSADTHHFATPDPICRACPERRCQDGPDGRRYRETRIQMMTLPDFVNGAGSGAIVPPED